MNNQNQDIFKTSNYDSSPFLGQLRYERVIYIKGQRNSKKVLVKVVFFQLSGYGHPQYDVMPNFFRDSKSSILGLSNGVSFVSEFF